MVEFRDATVGCGGTLKCAASKRTDGAADVETVVAMDAAIVVFGSGGRS